MIKEVQVQFLKLVNANQIVLIAFDINKTKN